MSMIAGLEQLEAINTASLLTRTRGVARTTTTAQCLVLSLNPKRREMLVRSANEAGWDTVACADARAAWHTAQRERFAMALIDLESAQTCDAQYRDLAEHMMGSQRTLTVVCGHEGNAVEEIWARQTGVWLYLPGVTADCDIRGLCAEAMPVAEKVSHQRELATVSGGQQDSDFK